MLLFLRLGRASNLPTIWTNTLVAMACLGGNWEIPRILLLLLAGSLLYLAGCTWNDAQDAAWDAQHRPDRPIPSNIISAARVWRMGRFYTVGALALMASFGWAAFFSAVLVVVAILLYTLIHKKTAWAVLAMAWCRVQWVLTVAIACGWSLLYYVPSWSLYLLALAAAILSISLAARNEATKGPETSSKSLILALSSMFAIAVTAGLVFNLTVATFQPAIIFVWLIWMLWSLREMKTLGKRGIGPFVAKALAGLCLLDKAFLGNLGASGALVALAGFGLALLLQRWIPAT